MVWSLDERARPVPVRAARPGSVRDVDEGEVVPVVGRSPDGVSDDVVRGWLTAEPATALRETWRRWARRFDRSGLWPLERHPHLLLLARAWELRDSVSAHAAQYVALAELLDVPLVTGDGRLSRAPGLRCAVDLLR